MRTWLYVGSLAAGVLLLVYEYYCRRESHQNEGYYGHGNANGGDWGQDDEYLEIGNENVPPQLNNDVSNRRRVPGRDELCPICQDNLLKRDATRKYCLISLPGCGHWFHQMCALRLLEYHPMCPVCRIHIDSTMLRNTPVRVAHQNIDEDHGSTNSTSQ